MATSKRFEPREDENYGKCLSCGIDIVTVEDSVEHMNSTMKDSPTGSHSVSVINPTRLSRVQNGIDSVLDDALTRAAEEVDRMIDNNDITMEEADKAAANWPDFADFWDEWKDS